MHVARSQPPPSSPATTSLGICMHLISPTLLAGVIFNSGKNRFGSWRKFDMKKLLRKSDYDKNIFFRGFFNFSIS